MNFHYHFKTMKNLILILSFVILNSFFVIAEGLSGQALVDSLEAELPNAKGDTNHVNLLNNLSYEYYGINPDKGIKYGNIALELANKIDWQKGEAVQFFN